MKILNKLSFCVLLLSLHANAFAVNKVHDKQLLQAYDVLINQPAKKGEVRKPVVANNKVKRAAQVNATLVAKKQINKKYRWGGFSPRTGFDCSGLMQYAYKASRIYLPRTAAAQYRHTKRIAMKHLQQGDLIFFHTRRTRAKVNHVGIYLGGGKFIHAPRRGKLVSISELKGYWRKKAVGAGRV